jgi:hypothetical protein
VENKGPGDAQAGGNGVGVFPIPDCGHYFLMEFGNAFTAFTTDE